MLEAIKAFDRQLLLAINHGHARALDAVMLFASNRLVWFPAYALLIGWLIYHFRRRAVLLLPLVVLAVALADSITSRLFKPFFARPRPCHDGALLARLHLPDGCGGQFGFLSSHAANSMALAVFLAVVLPPGRFRALRIGVFLWAILLSYSRMYLGAHYPTDVLGGAIIGALLGALAALAYRQWSPRLWPEKV
ncbi:phosphatase PAP2 family protein [Hymenobacter ruricola]|uniref:Phosphatase PAP2 family protein n=1 Tax=Hymenobacter ruricola TaxID=2791023 RepID=A0ABS0I0R3_9BACT|nr:phosphatase PAP2 family protein [Hymenobacter ruricola]MBF9220371.1 phosphatase PAP2 family protein [Hymenobacter ruricola]